MELNWKNVKEKFPNSAEVLLSHYRSEYPFEDEDEIIDKHGPVYLIEDMLAGNPRDLFDFFDAQGFYLGMDVSMDSDGNLIFDNGFSAHPTRPEAEIAGFWKGFEVLEEKLAKEKQNG